MKLSKKLSDFLYEHIFPKLGYWIIVLLFMTIRMRWFNDSFVFECQKKDKPVIFAFWHNRLLYMGFAGQFRHKKHKLAALASKSKDGRLIGKILNLFNLTAVYGSSTRGGSEAMRELVRYMTEKKYDVAISPDGPRGPKYSVQQGVVRLAQSTGIPIIPVVYDVKHKIRLKSWDGFYIPLPFTWGVYMYGDPIEIPATMTEEEREKWKLVVGDGINKIAGQAKEWIVLNS